MSVNLVFSYLCAAVVFFVIDMVWLGWLAKDFYQDQLGGLLRQNVNWTAAIIFYLLFIIGIFIFAIVPGLEATSLRKAALLGALFGFFTYATYDLTNFATLSGWPLRVVIVDILWGMVLTAAVASAGYLISIYFNVAS